MSLRSVRDELKALRAEISNPRLAERITDAQRRKLARQICYIIAAAAVEKRGMLHDMTPLSAEQRAWAWKLKGWLSKDEPGRQFVAKLEGMAR